uniref:Uncharacterized protein n=1 Tax=Octopus bimaculoides TaxID=37653 RepID=A0A0L8GSA7_OCTBM
MYFRVAGAKREGRSLAFGRRLRSVGWLVGFGLDFVRVFLWLG